MSRLALALWLRAAVAVPAPPPPPGTIAAPAPPTAGRDDDADAAARSRHDVVVTGSFTVHPGDHVRDAVAVGGSVEVEGGGSARDAVAVGGSVHVQNGGTVERDAVAVGGSVRVDPGGRVGRDATSVGGSVDSTAEGSVGRDRVGLGLPGVGSLLALASGALGLGALFSPLWLLGSFLARLVVFLACGLVLLALWPQRLDAVADELARAPGRSVLLGCVAAALLPPLAVLFAVTIVGIPLAMLEAVAVAVGSAFGYSALALLLGRRLPLGKAHPALRLAVGWFLLELVFSVPLLGLALAVALWTWTFGAVIGSRFGRAMASPPLPPPAAPIAPPPAAA